MPEKTIHIDFARFNSAGFGTVHGDAAAGLHTGEVVALTDDEADTVEAEVLDVRDGAATLLAHWDHVLHDA